MKRKSVLCLSVLLTLVVLGFGVVFAGSLWAAEPKPGDVINAANVDQYNEYFPNFVQQFIKGTDFARPAVITLRETEIYSAPANYMEWAEKNRGKLTIDSEGNIEGSYMAGMPFPDPKEPNLAEKVMWNFYYRWRTDQWYYRLPGWVSYSQRKGGPLLSQDGTQFYMYFSNRTSVDPKPNRANPHGLFFAFVQHYPTGRNRDLDFLIWRYQDPLKNDEMWSYVPTLRRTLRLVSGERSNPVRGTAATYDDYYGFDGKIHEFTYKFIKKDPQICLMHQITNGAATPDGKYYNGYDHPLLDADPWELWDNYLIEIKAKNPRYPESKRMLWVADKIFYATAAETFDKSGRFWKGLWQGYRPETTSKGEVGPWMSVQSYNDFKTSYWTGVIGRDGINCANCEFDPKIFEPGVLGQPLF